MREMDIILIETDPLDAKLFKCCSDYYQYKTNIFLVGKDEIELSKEQLSELEDKLKKLKVKVVVSEDLWGQWKDAYKIAKKYNVPFILHTEGLCTAKESKKKKIEYFSKLLNPRSLFYRIKDLSKL